MVPGGTFIMKPFREADPFAFSTVEVPYTAITGTKVRGAFNGHEQMSILGGGAETRMPRCSHSGRWVRFTSAGWAAKVGRAGAAFGGRHFRASL